MRGAEPSSGTSAGAAGCYDIISVNEMPNTYLLQHVSMREPHIILGDNRVRSIRDGSDNEMLFYFINFNEKVNIMSVFDIVSNGSRET